jgi:hypothetical protein
VSARVCAALTAAVAAVLLVPLPAEAHRAQVADKNDTPGLLDIRRITSYGKRRPRVKVTTYKGWTAARMWDHGDVLVYLDTFSNKRFDYYVLVRSDGHKMMGKLYRDRKVKKDYIVGRTDAWKTEKRSVTVRIPLRKTNWPKSRAFYRWYALSMFTGPKCRRVCFDRAPQQKAVKELRAGVSGSPSPSPSP